jgi:hypothetical protein
MVSEGKAVTEGKVASQQALADVSRRDLASTIVRWLKSLTPANRDILEGVRHHENFDRFL